MKKSAHTVKDILVAVALGLLDELLEEIPADLSKTKRVKLYKEKVKALFPMAGK